MSPDAREQIQHSKSSPAQRVIYALLGFLLVGGLVSALFWAWNSPTVPGRYSVKQAYGLLDEGRYIEATDLLERLLLRYNDPETRLALSFAYLARRDTERAERQARLVLASGRLDMYPAAWTQVGRVLQAAGREDEALGAWRMAESSAAPYRGIPRIEADRRSAAWHTATLLWARGEWEAARLPLETLMGESDVYAFSARVKLVQLLDPGSPAFEVRSKQLLNGLQSLPTVAPSTPSYFTAASPPRSSPNLRVPGLEEGLSAGEISRIASGLQAAQAEIIGAKERGAEDEAILLWGSTLLQQGEPRLAKIYLERAAKLAPNSADAQGQMGLVLLANGDIEGGISHLQAARSLNPKLPLPYHALAQLYTQRGQWDAALHELDALKTVEPGSTQRQLELAEYYRLRGEYKEAEDAYIEAVRSQQLDRLTTPEGPGEVDAPLTLARFYIDVRGQGCDKGLEPAQQALAAHPGNADALDAVGWSLLLCGRQKEAQQPLERAVAASPDVPSYHFHLAGVYAAGGRIADAQEQYTRVQDLDPGGSWSNRAITELAKLEVESHKLKVRK